MNGDYSSCGVRAPHRPLASLVEQRLYIVPPGALEWGLRSCGAWAQLSHSMRNLLRPGVVPVSPVLTGRFLTTEPSGKSILEHFNS